MMDPKKARCVFIPAVIMIAVVLLNAFDVRAERDVVHFNSNWRFAKGSHEQSVQPEFDDSAWEQVRLPHDWAIAGPFDPQGSGNTGKLPWKGEGWYRKTFRLDRANAGKHVILLFDAVMAFPTVWINGRKAGSWDYGYNSFQIDAT